MTSTDQRALREPPHRLGQAVSSGNSRLCKALGDDTIAARGLVCYDGVFATSDAPTYRDVAL